ncbi:DUF881 domain-containing protein [Isoptericola variabilis]|uniref:Membrane spanning protein DUF881 n=1 Tax=Isoptericola variabilis (strain 225) TaxID=743718 RepID=F6FQ80_ISOV2|nr:DUF881 domain-containing protein [Isoptericola variabilis]AEG42833.1 protein of unknown function DUF881 [Isoptericola variabilis 225]TWH33735.1 uncharacterized protein YlxW (UPF0749 family) [Isoptericola variabilis J7]
MDRRFRSALVGGSVLAAAGLLFTVSAQLADTRGSRHPEDLAQLVRAEAERVERLSERVESLEAEVARLGEAAAADLPSRPADLVARESVLSGSRPVSGPGLTVTLDDAPASSASIPGARPDDLVVHQQDMEHVINALWAGGAEAMTLQGERVTSTSAFRCSGNILLLHGKVFSPPYVIEAVGDPQALRAALDASPGVATYKQYVDWVALGWSVQTSDEFELPPYTGATELRHARVPEGTDVFS